MIGLLVKSWRDPLIRLDIVPFSPSNTPVTHTHTPLSLTESSNFHLFCRESPYRWHIRAHPIDSTPIRYANVDCIWYVMICYAIHNITYIIHVLPPLTGCVRESNKKKKERKKKEGTLQLNSSVPDRRLPRPDWTALSLLLPSVVGFSTCVGDGLSHPSVRPPAARPPFSDGS